MESDAACVQVVVEQLLRDRPAHLRYFDTVCRRLSVKMQSSLHTQRLLVLYFGVVGSDLMGVPWPPPPNDADDLLSELRNCYDADGGGFTPEPTFAYATSATVAMTQCALHALNTTGLLQHALSDWLDAAAVTSFVLSCQLNSRRGNGHVFGRAFDGAFSSGPDILETDLRFTYSALVALALVHSPLPLSAVAPLRSALAEAVEFVHRCWDAHSGGFGAFPGAESHGGMTFCAVAALALAGALHTLTATRRHAVLRYCTARVAGGPDDYCAIGWTDSLEPLVGFQGRPQKNCDTCYTHWVGCALHILAPADALVRVAPIVRFVGRCTCGKIGGIAKCAESSVDPLHACLGLSGLLLFAGETAAPPLRRPHPVYGCSWATARAAGLPDLIPKDKPHCPINET